MTDRAALYVPIQVAPALPVPPQPTRPRPRLPRRPPGHPRPVYLVQS